MRRTEIVDMIRSILHKVAPNAQIILYGSEARGDEPQLTPEYEQEIIRPLYELEVKSGVIISPMIMLRRLWENRPFQTPFSLNVMNEGIVL